MKTKKLTQLNTEQLDSISIVYTKDFIKGRIEQSFLIWSMENIESGYYINNSQVNQAVSLIKKLLYAFGPEHLVIDFKELNN